MHCVYPSKNNPNVEHCDRGWADKLVLCVVPSNGMRASDTNRNIIWLAGLYYASLCFFTSKISLVICKLKLKPALRVTNNLSRSKEYVTIMLNSTQLNSTQRCFYCQILAHHSTTKSTNYYTSVGKYYTKYNLHVKRLHIMWPVPDNGSWKPQRVCGPLVWYKSMVQKGALCNRRTTPISKGGYDSCKNR